VFGGGTEKVLLRVLVSFGESLPINLLNKVFSYNCKSKKGRKVKRFGKTTKVKDPTVLLGQEKVDL
jgi:hypothetical protein